MLPSRAVGRDAATKKYDMLSALMAFALAQDKHTQRRVMRFMSLVTTRYNWQRDELTMGQKEIARLWSVDLRTVKREMAKLRSAGWLTVKKAATRGNVATHGINFNLLLSDTEAFWPNVGPDLVDRLTIMTGGEETADKSNVIPFSANGLQAPDDGTFWAGMADRLLKEDPATYSAWFQHLNEAGREDATLVLVTASKFHAAYVQTHLTGRLILAARELDPSIRDVKIIA